MNEIKPNERHLILNNYKYFNEQDLSYWYNILNKRIEYLTPLINELNDKNIKLKTLSNDLAQEIFEIKELIKLIELFIAKN